MPQSGFTGISYPFRISNRGGVVMSTTSRHDPSHISESIQQIFNTNFLVLNTILINIHNILVV